MHQTENNSKFHLENDFTDVVYIVAPTQRSGTNFLGEVIKTTGNFSIPEPMTEAYLFRHSPRLIDLANKLIDDHSNPQYFEREENHPNTHKELIMNELGESMLRYLNRFKPADKRLLLKVPHSANLDHFFHLFPNAKLLLLARDGRDVVESTLRTWPEKEFKHECKKWGWRAKQLSDFMVNNADQENQRWMFVRYENLVNDIVPVAQKIFEFIGEEKKDWHEQALLNLPIIGSSTYRGEEKTNRIHFQPIEKQHNEKFLKRWESWSSKLKRRFKRRAGEELIRLGFTKDLNW